MSDTAGEGRQHLAHRVAAKQEPRLAGSARAPHFGEMSSSVIPIASPPRPFWVDGLIAVAAVVAASLLGNAVTLPQIGGWYAGLSKPWFNPPNWVFGPAWTTLFSLMAYSVYRILRLPASTSGKATALVVYHGQLAFNVLWSCVFFGLNSPLGGLFVIAPFWGLILATILLFRPLDRTASLLLWPYLAWVSYATVLNVAIWWLNRGS